MEVSFTYFELKFCGKSGYTVVWFLQFSCTLSLWERNTFVDSFKRQRERKREQTNLHTNI